MTDFTTLRSRHLKACVRSYRRYTETKNKRDLYKTVYHGVIVVGMFPTNDPELTPEVLFGFIESIRECVSSLTPRELTQSFPVEKIYDGARYETKDYFSTMEVLERHGLDTPIGESLDDIIWDYMNMNTRMFFVKCMGIVHKLYESATGVDPLKEAFIEMATKRIVRG